MEKEQLGTLLRDLDALKQHPDDLASTIDRVIPPTWLHHGSRQFL